MLGPLVTAWPVADYAAHPAVPGYFFRNLTLVSLQYELPGVFGANPYPGAVNGSLWTLFYEAGWYGAVLGIGLLGALCPRRFAGFLAGFLLAYLAWFRLADPAGLAGAPAERLAGALVYRMEWVFALGLPFALGMAFYVWRARLPLHPLGLLGLIAAAALSRATPLYPLLLALALAYGVFLFGYRARGAVQRYNALGDYSYGVYVYAFPMQQTAMHLFAPPGPLANILIALPATLVLAVLSWHVVEKPALAAVRRRGPRAPATRAPVAMRP